MPRFGTRSLLIGFAVLALWLSTLTGYEAGDDVRAAILQAGIFAAAFAAIYHRGRQQAFWLGFVGALLLVAIEPNWQFVPHFTWPRDTFRNWAVQTPVGPLPPNAATDLPGFQLYGRQGRVYSAMCDTFWVVCAVLLSVFVGLVGAFIHNHSKPPDRG
jgi:hypothetical protein